LKNLISDIKNNTIKHLYLITGEEIFLEEYYLKDLINCITDGNSDDFNTMIISRETTEELNISSFVDSYPLMSEKKILIIKNTGILKKATDEEKRFWPKLLDDIPDYAIIVFYENEIDKRNSIYKSIAKNGYIAEFPYQSGSALNAWVNKIFKSNQKQIDSDLIEYLISSCNPGMINIKTEIEKLISYKRDNPKITKYDIDTLVTKSLESRVFEMAEDIAKGDVNSAQKKLEDIKKLNTKPIEILPAIFSKFCNYKKTKCMEYLPISQIAAKLKSREYFVKKDLSIIKNLSTQQLNDIIKMCQSADFKIKSGQSDGWQEIANIIMCCK
jgi:DNA polymerase-3 subunit delta